MIHLRWSSSQWSLEFLPRTARAALPGGPHWSPHQATGLTVIRRSHGCFTRGKARAMGLGSGKWPSIEFFMVNSTISLLAMFNGELWVNTGTEGTYHYNMNEGNHHFLAAMNGSRMSLKLASQTFSHPGCLDSGSDDHILRPPSFYQYGYIYIYMAILKSRCNMFVVSWVSLGYVDRFNYLGFARISHHKEMNPTDYIQWIGSRENCGKSLSLEKITMISSTVDSFP